MAWGAMGNGEYLEIALEECGVNDLQDLRLALEHRPAFDEWHKLKGRISLLEELGSLGLFLVLLLLLLLF